MALEWNANELIDQVRSGAWPQEAVKVLALYAAVAQRIQQVGGDAPVEDGGAELIRVAQGIAFGMQKIAAAVVRRLDVGLPNGGMNAVTQKNLRDVVAVVAAAQAACGAVASAIGFPPRIVAHLLNEICREEAAEGKG